MNKLIIFPILFVLAVIPNPAGTFAYGQCSEQYGFMAYEDFSGGCKCVSGYVFGTDIFGKTACVSGDSICNDELGYNSSYDSLSNSCKCDYGYVNTGSSCESGRTVCYRKHGYNSEYENYSKSCKCSYGYTLDENNQCVKKQNNVYFTLKELDTDNKLALIRSQYDYRFYLVKYGFGCYSASFRSYLNDNIVVNLGTDFSVDSYDKIVLQDDNEVCDITRVERANSSTTLFPDTEEPARVYTPRTIPKFTPAPNSSTGIQKPQEIFTKSVPALDTLLENDILVVEDGPAITSVDKSINTENSISQKSENQVISFFKKITNWFKSLFS